MKNLLCGALATAFVSYAHAAPPLEVYGTLPEVGQMAISPSGSKMVYLTRRGEDDYMLVSELNGNLIGGANANRVKARAVGFPTEDIATASASTTAQVAWIKYEQGKTVAYNIDKNKLHSLEMNEGSFPQAYGSFVAIDRDNNIGYMTGFDDGALNVYKVNLENGRGSKHANGTTLTSEWFMESDGTIIAREDYDREKGIYKLRAKEGRDWRPIVEKFDVERRPYNIYGMTPDNKRFVVGETVSGEAGFEVVQVKTIDFDGTVGERIFTRGDGLIGGFIRSQDSTVIGVRYEGLTPTYEFLDQNLDSAIGKVVDDLTGLYVSVRDFTADYSKALLHISGSGLSPSYFLLDVASGNLSRLSQQYPAISDADVGEKISIEYKARDGLPISAIVTLPAGKSFGDKLPLVVLPHGGPAAYDNLSFDWMANGIASRGYMVLQPNFRGSTGFGEEFTRAGDQEWGKSMQHDVTDGVQKLIKTGWADPDRICIMGHSYGGYAALAGGAYTPDLYKCIVAGAPVSDLVKMSNWEKSETGRNSEVVKYWAKVMGDVKEVKDYLVEASPAKQAENFTAPVLLIHGVDDTVVPFEQSRIMESALKKANKSVRVVKLKNEDHWLSVSESRLKMLTEAVNFIDEHIGE
ncbi:MAG: alpha/beta fold hydrolase [Pseudomonadota bacterium]